MRQATYWKGDRAEYTGRSQFMYGAMFYELELMEGHRAGDCVWTIDAPAK